MGDAREMKTTEKSPKGLRRFSRNTWIAIVGVAFGILLLASGSLFTKDNTKQAAGETAAVSYYTEYLEKRVVQLCKSVRGVTDANVLLTLEKGSEWVYARDEAGQNAELVIVQKSGGEEAVTVTEIYPEIRGIAVVCTGGDDARIQTELTELLSASLGIPTHRIKIAGM